MCKECIISHLAALMQNASKQAMVPGASAITIRLDAVQPCKPFNCKEVHVSDYHRTFVFPGIFKNNARNFAITLRLCEQILSNLKEDKVITTRDLYYKDVSLFKNQETVVRALDKICRCLVVPRSWLNVQPSPNGLVAGDLTIILKNGESQEVKRSNGSTLIPVGEILHVSAPVAPKYILIIEKEAVFSYLQNELPEGVLVTGKGFPDRATRNLVTALTVAFPQLSVYCLVDSDPHGILILRNYECGSSKSVEYQSPISVKYLGISLLEYSEGLVPSTVNDLKVAMSTLKKSWIGESKYHKYKQELQRGLFMGLKGEMNLLDQDQSIRLSSYVRRKIRIEPETSSSTAGEDTFSPRLVVYDPQLNSVLTSRKRKFRSKFSIVKRPSFDEARAVKDYSIMDATDLNEGRRGFENYPGHL